jgi:hypothetical protein
MSHPSRDSLPSGDEAIAILREAGLPVYDQFVIGAILDSDETPADKRAALLAHNCAKAFTSDDPVLWSEAQDRLATLRALWQQRDQGTIDATAYDEQTRHAVTDCVPDLCLAVLHLLRCQCIAFDRVLRRRMARN